MRTWLRALLLVVLLALSACSPKDALGLLAGGGPNVAANTQVGQENTQTVGQSQQYEQTIVRPQARDIQQNSGNSGVQSDRVERVYQTNVDWWMMVLYGIMAGFLIPSPKEIARGIRGLFQRRRPA